MMEKFHIVKPSDELRGTIRDKIDNLNKPKGSLGRLEELAEQICLIQQTLHPVLRHPCHLLFGADHGIEREQVSVSPREVTWQQMINFTKGGGGVNMFCQQHHFDLRIIDIGVDHDLSDHPSIINRKIAPGTKNFLYGPAMSEAQYHQALSVGAAAVDDCAKEGCNVICMGEMGIANTSPSSIWMSIFGNLPLKECIGIGSGVSSAGLFHKKNVLCKALERFENIYLQPTTDEIVRYFGGFEMVGAVGAMLRAAELKMIILVDGFIMSACILAASRLCPDVLHYAVFGHCSGEVGHQEMLHLMDARPLLHLQFRLGEGTGALCAYPLIESAVKMINEMNNFKDANITKYF